MVKTIFFGYQSISGEDNLNPNLIYFLTLRWRERLGRSVSSQPLVRVFLCSAFPSSPDCSAAISIPRGLGLSIPRDCGNTIDKFGFEEHVGIVKHAVFKRHHNKLGMLEMSPKHLADVLGV